jgi:hypothetical protein
MKTFDVSFRYQDRKAGPEGATAKIDASSLSGAIAKATREFVKGLDRKQRFDMNKNGLEIKAKSVTSSRPAKETATARSWSSDSRG